MCIVSRVDLHLAVRAFVAVARHHGFSEAASREQTSQPVMSRRVAALESRVGGPLLDRSTRRVALTPLGRTLLPHAERLLDVEEALLAAAAAHGRDARRVLVPPGLDPSAWSRVVLLAGARGRRLEITEEPRSRREAALDRGEVEAAVLGCPGRQPDWRVPLGLGHDPDDESSLRLLRPTRASRGSAATVLVTAEDAEPSQLSAIRRTLAQLGLGHDQVRVADNLVSALALVTAGDARILCAPAQAASWGLAWRSVPELGLERRYRLATTRTDQAHDDDVLRAIGDALGAEAPA